MRSFFLSGVLFLGALLLFTGCDSTETDIETVPGTYQAVTFMADIDGEMVDVLAAGGALDMTLQADGTVAGRLLIPAALAGEDNQDLDVDLGGTYTLDGETVTFSQTADTFIRDVDWTFDDGTLRLDTDAFEIVLEKQ